MAFCGSPRSGCRTPPGRLHRCPWRRPPSTGIAAGLAADDRYSRGPDTPGSLPRRPRGCQQREGRRQERVSTTAGSGAGTAGRRRGYCDAAAAAATPATPRYDAVDLCAVAGSGTRGYHFWRRKRGPPDARARDLRARGPATATVGAMGRRQVAREAVGQGATVSARSRVACTRRLAPAPASPARPAQCSTWNTPGCSAVA
jgi:hypothetical protein